MEKGLALLLLLSVLSFWSCNKSETITIASDCTWPPMEMIDANQEIVGFDIDLIKAVADEAGIEIVIKNTTWDGIFAGLSNNTYDGVISSVTITEDRKETMDFTIPYINAGQVLIVPKDSDALVLADLAGENVGAQIGTTGAFVIEDSASVLKNYDELGFAIEDLANGNLKAVVCDSPIAADYVLSNENYKAILKIVGEPFTEDYYGIAVKKGNTAFLNKLNAGIEAIIASGKRDELIDTWLR
ncbi:MAG: basic amino acid ABC transporter substrate-binding protein [Spirochaetaceae bacterium]|jgi:polar amino acid transport system substrate-binding protein|nr:basic amino acid ABC transporter substrate-binding protein [Spirochaetaceae bacterium]